MKRSLVGYSHSLEGDNRGRSGEDTEASLPLHLHFRHGKREVWKWFISLSLQVISSPLLPSLRVTKKALRAAVEVNVARQTDSTAAKPKGEWDCFKVSNSNLQILVQEDYFHPWLFSDKTQLH